MRDNAALTAKNQQVAAKFRTMSLKSYSPYRQHDGPMSAVCVEMLCYGYCKISSHEENQF